MSIQAIRKCGFLVEDGVSWGEIIGILRYDTRTPQSLRLAEQMDGIRAQNYYEPIQPMLITEEIEEIPAISPVAPAKPVEFVHLGLEVKA